MTTSTANTIRDENILITRPNHNIDSLNDLLVSHGANTIHMPCLSIEPIENSSIEYGIAKQHILDLDLFDIVICVSPNAARFAVDLIDQYWPQLPIKISWFAIGPATAKRLTDIGIQAIVTDGLSQSEELLEHEQLQSVAGKKVLILKGNSGRELLSEVLMKRSAIVSQAALYNRAIPVYTDLQIQDKLYQSNLSAIFISSGDVLKNLMEIAKGSTKQFNNAALLDKKLFVPSVRVKEIAKSFGYKHIFVAHGADDQSMLAKLLSVNYLEADNEKA